MNCISGGSLRAFQYPTVIEWDIAGSFRNGGRITLRNVYHSSCYLGGCGTFDGGYGMSCCTADSSRSRTYTDLRTFQVSTPGIPKGRWHQLTSSHRQSGSGDTLYTMSVGKTTTSGRTLSTSVSATLTTSLSSSVGFEAPAGPTASTTATVETSVTSEISTAYSNSVARSTVESVQVPCGAPAGETAWLWQWVVDVPTWDGSTPVTANVRSSNTVCLHGNGMRRPVCPLGRNRNADYSQCN